MSTALLELESHAWHLHRATGTVVVAGLGLGMFVCAAAAKPDVDRVIVAELDRDVIELMMAASDIEAWPFRDKVTVIHADALAPSFADRVAELTGGAAPDYLYADIWPCYPDERAPGETCRMVETMRPIEAGWWGQELAFAYWCESNEVEITVEAFDRFFAETGVPATASRGYLDFCRQVAEANEDELLVAEEASVLCHP